VPLIVHGIHNVIAQNLICVVAALTSGQAVPEPGSISGIVVNGSRNDAPVAGAEVVLRVRVNREFVVAAETTTDKRGQFRFDNIPADPDYIYLPGANWQAVHYPGRRLRLNSQRRDVNVRLRVHDAVEEPNPLVVSKHEIVIETQPDALRITESMVVDNPGQTTYVGRSAKADGRVATLTLSIPADFVRTTFHKEFYGKRFVLIDGKLVTNIPWTPGRRELKFTYVLPNPIGNRVWLRPVDRPTSDVHVVVLTTKPDEVAGNLNRTSSRGAKSVEFAAETLSAGQFIEIEFGRPPVSLAAYGRWVALVVLAGAIAATIGVRAIRKRKRRIEPAQSRRAAARRS
jgi:hypothetical protein